MTDSNATAGFEAPETAELAPLFPGYEIQGLIATGGMGAVYCALQKSLDRTVALKILPKEFSKDAAFCAGFEAEAKAMARLNHPNLIGVYDFGEVNGMLYIMMEYVPGESVYHLAYGRALPPAEAVRLVTGICHGLAHAHENGIIHRDIKPSNILLDTSGHPKIGDFGLARPAERKVEEGEEIFGTPHYTAPEVVNSPHSVDHRADIFSVGVMLHELLTGKLPANDLRPTSVIGRCDVRFDAIIKRATHPVAASRYASATELANDLLAITTQKTGASNLPRRVQPRRPSPVSKKKGSGNGFIIAIILISALTAGALYFLDQKNKESEPVKVVTPAPAAPAPAPVKAAELTEEEKELEKVLSHRPSDRNASSPDPAADDSPATTPKAIKSGTPAPASTFDVAGFLDRAKDVMRRRAEPLVSARENNQRANLADYQRTVQTFRSQKIDGERVDQLITNAMADWEDNRIPEDPGVDLDDAPKALALHESHFQKQTSIDETFQQAVTQLSSTYAQGIELQIQKLKIEEDADAIVLLREEIERTQDDAVYFPESVLKITPIGD